VTVGDSEQGLMALLSSHHAASERISQDDNAVKLNVT
jgi:hypothetical protein